MVIRPDSVFISRSKRAWRLELVLGLALLATAVWLAWRFRDHGQSWDWAYLGRCLLRRDPETGAWTSGALLLGLWGTLRLSAWAMALGLVCGLAAGLARLGRGLFLRLAAGAYVQTARNLPPLALLFIGYFFLGDQIFAWLGLDAGMRAAPGWVQDLTRTLCGPPERLPGFLAAAATLGLYEGAYVAEIARAGVQSVERGQWEAAWALGLSPWQRMRRVILPQAWPRMLPGLAGQFVSTIKDSSIVSVVSVSELTFQSLQLMNASFKTMEIWSATGALYLALCLPCALLCRWLETRLASMRP
jgi:polar amino acid transport system permease protein